MGNLHALFEHTKIILRMAPADSTEEVLERMLTLQRRALNNDKPLPLSKLQLDSSCAAAGAAPGASISRWSAELAAQQSLPAAPRSTFATTFAGGFRAVGRAISDGRFVQAQQVLRHEWMQSYLNARLRL